MKFIFAALFLTAISPLWAADCRGTREGKEVWALLPDISSDEAGSPLDTRGIFKYDGQDLTRETGIYRPVLSGVIRSKSDVVTEKDPELESKARQVCQLLPSLYGTVTFDTQSYQLAIEVSGSVFSAPTV